MILTCPACATQYTVTDGAIPPEGRKVRCASCKHSWHQDGHVLVLDDEIDPAIGPPVPELVEGEEPVGEAPEQAIAGQMIADEPQPEVGEHWASDAPAQGLDDYAPPAEALEAPLADEDYQGFAAIPAMRYDDDEPPRRGRAIGWIALLVLLVVAAAAAFWFLAPPEYKARLGIAEAGATPLELMLTTSDRQKLASGNELLAISGRIINPTDREQAVPPINAELRNKTTKALVHSWTIPLAVRVLPPRGTASFNSAEVDIPEGGDELTVTLGGQPG